MSRTGLAGVMAVGVLGGSLASGAGLGDVAARESARRNPPVSDCQPSAEAVLRWSPTPEYPRVAGAEGSGGTVALEIVVGVDGRVKRVHVRETGAAAGLVASARQAVLERLYCPAFRGGEPIESRLSVRMSYVLPPNRP